jgi:hypothetical protein
MPRIGSVIARASAVSLLVVLAACGGGGDDGDAGDASGDGGSGLDSGDLSGGESQVLGDADEGIEGVQSIRVYYPQQPHTEDTVDYSLRPPAGGIHHPIWWNCGFYDEPIPDENVVHDLEHAAVWLAYSPDLSDDDVEVIHDLARSNPKVIAAPYPGLADDEAVVATAWARQLRLDSVDDPRLGEFIDQYVDGKQAPESGATCSGTPLGNPIP